MTPLRKKMIRELELQRKSPSTVRAYVRGVAGLAEYYGRSPEKIAVEEIRDYLHYLITERELAFESVNQALAGLRFFYRQVLGRDQLDLRVPAKRSGRLPEPLSRQEVGRLLDAATYPKHRMLLMTAYATGLRTKELVRLRLEDVHSDRMLIRVNQGKGRKDRYTLLSQRLLEELRRYWRTYRPSPWLFLNRDQNGPMPRATAGRIYSTVKQRAGLQRGRGLHTLRHSFASHLCEAGVPLPVIQRLLGHRYLSTTMRYLHVTEVRLTSLESPLDLLRLPRAEDLRQE
jgi:site-specific recombinase XerD